MTPPLRRFLGVDDDADDRTLLGVTVPVRRLTAAHVDLALAERLTRLARHPDATSDAARVVRERLIAAADRLRPAPVGSSAAAGAPVRPAEPVAPKSSSTRAAGAPAPKRPTPPGSTVVRRPQSSNGAPDAPKRPSASASAPIVRHREPIRLTQFDRTVLALLVAGGGWNARSRSLLVSLAAARGIPPHALLQVVRGLGQHIRDGGGRPAPDELSQSISNVPWRGGQREPTRFERVVDQIEETMVDELRGERLASRFRVTVVFAILTLVSGVIFLRLLLAPGTDASPPDAVVVAEVDRDPSARADRRADEGARTGGSADGSRDGGRAERGSPALIFVGGESLRGARRPQDALDALEKRLRLIEELGEVRRHAALAEDRPSEIMRQRWIAAIADAGACWPLLEPNVRGALVDEFVAVVRDSGSSSISDALLDALQPRNVGREPLDLWRAAFASGVLGEILLGSANMPLAAGRAARHVQGWTGTTVPASDAGFSQVAGLLLDRHVARLVDDTLALPVSQRSIDQAMADRWETWFEAQRSLRSEFRMQRSVLTALESMLRSGRDLSASGTVAALAARLVEALRPSTPAVRTAILRWYVDESIDSNAMWVLTGLLLAHRKPPEMVTDLAIPWDASIVQREHLADRLAQRWPEETFAVGGVTRRWMEISEQMRERWNRIRDEEEAAAQTVIRRGDDVALMQRLLVGSLINEAMACLIVGDESAADERLSMAIGLGSADDSRLRRHPLRRLGMPVARQRSNDGSFAEGLRSDRDHESRLARLRALRLESISDLGPVDAADLVRIAVRAGQSAEVRSTARAMLVEQFQNGPHVIRALLEILPDAILNDDLSDAIARITGRSLPPLRGGDWMVQARVALLDHLLLLATDPGFTIDLYAENLAESYRQRELLTGSPFAQSGAGAGSLVAADERRPQVAIVALVDAWRDRTEAVVAARPLLETIEIDRRRQLRRRLSDGGVARLVAEQITLLELVATVIAGEAPTLRDQVDGVLTDAAVWRRQATSALEQAVMTEFALTRLWREGVGHGTGVAVERPTPDDSDAAPRDERTASPAGDDDGMRGRPDPEVTPIDRGPGRRQDTEQIEPPRMPPPTRGPGPRRRLVGRRIVPAPPRSRLSMASSLTIVVAISLAALLVRHGGAGPRHAAPEVASAMPNSAAADATRRWEPRLVALAHDDPDAYFLLGEEVADEATTDVERWLAQKLFGLAGTLAPDRLAHSACLALADLSDGAEARRRFRAAAALLDRRGGSMMPRVDDAAVEPATALAFSEMLGQLRQGHGQLANRLLANDRVRALLEQHEGDFGLAPGRIESDIGAYRGGQRRPQYGPHVLWPMLRVELGLLAGTRRPFSSDVILGNEPLTEIDPDRLDELFGVNPAESIWRDGRWRRPDGA